MSVVTPSMHRENGHLPQRRIYGFMHIAACGNFRDIAIEQLNRLQKSGLLDATSKLHVVVLGNATLPFLTQPPSTCALAIKTFSNLQLFERTCLNWMREVAEKSTEDDLVWYIHTKGVTSWTKPQYPYCEKWRRLMESVVIDKWRQCRSTIERGIDNVGILFRKLPWPHFSGNFWWSHVHHVRKLPFLSVDDKYLAVAAQGRNQASSDYYEPERWICAAPCAVFSAFELDDKFDLYSSLCPSELESEMSFEHVLNVQNVVSSIPTRELTIYHASYGIPNQWKDVTLTVRNLVRNNALRLSTDTNVNDLFGDPVPGVPKYLRIFYAKQVEHCWVHQCWFFRENCAHLKCELVL